MNFYLRKLDEKKETEANTSSKNPSSSEKAFS